MAAGLGGLTAGVDEDVNVDGNGWGGGGGVETEGDKVDVICKLLFKLKLLFGSILRPTVQLVLGKFASHQATRGSYSAAV